MKRYVAAAVAILVGLGAVLLSDAGEEPTDSKPVSGPPLPRGAREAMVVRVVDGDTVELGGGLGKSRLIGIDTPEVYGGVECYGREASAYAKRQLEGRRIRYTVGREDRDRYGRLLVYLWLEDGRSFNAMLVGRGYAQPLTIQPNSDYAELFTRLSRRAREQAVGLWARADCPGDARVLPRKLREPLAGMP